MDQYFSLYLEEVTRLPPQSKWLSGKLITIGSEPGSDSPRAIVTGDDTLFATYRWGDAAITKVVTKTSTGVGSRHHTGSGRRARFSARGYPHLIPSKPLSMAGVLRLFAVLCALCFSDGSFAQFLDVSTRQTNSSSLSSIPERSWQTWGPYRPNLYFGVRPQVSETLLMGLMWASVGS